MPEPQPVFALLVAIDTYQPPVSVLQGAVQDAEAVRAYLQARPGVEVQIHTLYNEAATRTAVINGITRFLAQATVGQTTLLYYAGHGGREKAHARLEADSPTGLSEGLVLYDSITAGAAGSGLLIDKELRYLLHQLSQSQAHIITIFDCCHAGGNTRSGSDEVLRTRQYPPPGSQKGILPARNWSQYCFASTIPEETVQPVNLAAVFPEGKHVQLAACLPEQRATENARGGIFTQSLLKLLKEHKHRISYRDLSARLRQAVAIRYDQVPQVYIADPTGALLDYYFLTGEQGHFVWVDENEIAKDTGYADLSTLLSGELRIWVRAQPDTAPYATALNQLAVKFATREAEADYTLLLSAGMVKIVHPGGDDALVRPVELQEPAVWQKIADHLRHIKRWHNLLHLEGKGDYQVSIAIYQQNRLVPPQEDDTITLQYDQTFNGRPSGAIEIELVNSSAEDRFISLVYFDPHFQVYPRFLPEGTVRLPAGKSFKLQQIRLTLEEEVERYDWPGSTSWLQLIESDRFFSADSFALPALPGPFDPATRAGRSELPPEPDKPVADWVIQRRRLFMARPT